MSRAEQGGAGWNIGEAHHWDWAWQGTDRGLILGRFQGMAQSGASEEAARGLSCARPWRHTDRDLKWRQHRRGC